MTTEVMIVNYETMREIKRRDPVGYLIAKQKYLESLNRQRAEDKKQQKKIDYMKNKVSK